MFGRSSLATTGAVGALALAFLVSGCSSTDAPPAPAPAPSVSATEPPAAPAPTVEPVAVEAPALVAGDAVPADAVEELRESGVPVYVSPNAAGEGVVVDPTAPLPELVVADVEANAAAEAPATVTEFAARNTQIEAVKAEMKKAGLSAFYITRSGNYGADGSLSGQGYVVLALGVDGVREWAQAAGDTRSDTKDGALANAAGLLALAPDAPVIDLTN